MSEKLKKEIMKFETQIKKGFHGWAGYSEINLEGKDWKIITMKRYDGVISTIAQAGVKEIKNGYSTFTHVVHQDPSVKINNKPGVRATHKAVDSIHSESLEIFKARYSDIIN